MPQVAVTIAGRVYRMACGEGEEAHLVDLAKALDGRIGTMRGQFGEIGDQRITIMAAITIVDDLSDAQGRVAALQAEVAALAAERQALQHRIEGMGAVLAARLDEAVARMDDIARELAGDRRP